MLVLAGLLRKSEKPIRYLAFYFGQRLGRVKLKGEIMWNRLTSALVLTLVMGASMQAAGFPAEVSEIEYHTSLDGSLQPALFYAAESDEAVPLLVALHTWGFDYRQRRYNAPFARWAVDRGWAYIQPNFRGPNKTPQACGSELAVGDVRDAVRFARGKSKIDPTRIYLVGASGGGHMALLMAGRAPELWAGVSAWVPVTDLTAWYKECRDAGNDYGDIVAVTGGAPGSSPIVDKEYDRRSPLFHLKNAISVPLDINAGIRDGHEGSVPISHSLHAFNLLAKEDDRLSPQEIEEFTSLARVPKSVSSQVPALLTLVFSTFRV